MSAANSRSPRRSSGSRITDWVTKAALLILVAAVSFAGFAPAASAANPKTFATGTLIVPMDTASQNLGMFKAYGLVYKLLQSNIYPSTG